MNPAPSTPKPPSRLRFAAQYFACVFGLGFILGTVRTLWLLPALGERWAELAEFPLMMTGITLTARWLSRRHPGLDARALLQAGALATGLVLLADLGVGIGLRGMTLPQVFLDRDPVAGAAYYLGLTLFALAPSVFRRAGLKAKATSPVPCKADAPPFVYPHHHAPSTALHRRLPHRFGTRRSLPARPLFRSHGPAAGRRGTDLGLGQCQ